jgi:glucan phosphoethanolaminetransferase (alkaline phosphatase superfamily)
VGVCYITNADFSVRDDIYPVNVCYNLGVAIDRSGKTIRYWEKSNNFKFNTVATRDKNEKELYVLVIGETARADNFGIYGYSRNTTPELQKISDLFAFTDVVSQSNTTHKSVSDDSVGSVG